ncbi:MAG: hypothetical protein EAZ55_03230 [Cytophagales bacterium]|nr:MAG: hypothetical protein EAZ55_03230 [Cytophagales bacterium]
MQKKLLFTLIIFSCVSLSSWRAFAQAPSIIQQDSANVLRLPFGFTSIGEESFIGFRLQPELAFGKMGVGLDVPLLFSTQDGSFRTQEFQDGLTGVLRMVRYFRYGQKKRDKVYFRIGDLTGSYLGTGILMNNYTNSPSFERRKVGITFDVRPTDIFGIEGTYSDFRGFNLLAIRPYFRPLATTDIPILKTLEIGGSFVTDYTPEAVAANGELASTRFVKKGMNAFGGDISLTVLSNSFIDVRIFGQYSVLAKSDTLNNYFNREIADSLAAGRPIRGALSDGYDAGTGLSLGASARINFIADIFNLEARLERLWYSDHFLPQFFDAVYEIDKDAKMLALGRAKGINGIYGSLSAVFLNKVKVTGGLQIPDVVTAETPAFFFMNLDAKDFIPKIMVTGNYVKGGITNLEDAFTFDNRSLANLRVAYRLNKYLVVGADYRWTFAKVNENGVERFQATSMVMPYVGLDYPLNFGR